MSIDAALDIAHEAYEGSDRAAKVEALVRLQGLLDHSARGKDAERVAMVAGLLSRQLYG